MDHSLYFRKIPKTDILLEQEPMRRLAGEYGRDVLTGVLRQVLEEARRDISLADSREQAEEILRSIPGTTEKRVSDLFAPHIRKVINATGTILHTNLGRAPMSASQAERIAGLAGGYCNLEYDLETGCRGERYAHIEELLCRITGTEAAMVVNNNAAAVMLVLNTLASGGEVIVSRGELVEIGGKFRIPDVMTMSGAILAEAGTTNKTHLRDYENAVTADTRAIMKVHTSNYQIIGFTESVPAEKLRPLADRTGVPLIEDLGSGVFADLSRYGLPHEPTVMEAVAAGADVITFSGDKLLGGPQAGIIIGKKDLIGRMKKNPLTRVLRVDKFTVIALEGVLLAYQSADLAPERIPVLRMISEPADSVKGRAEKLASLLKERISSADITVEASEARTGGGSLPAAVIPSFAVVIRPTAMSTAALERRMRQLPCPVIARIADDAVIMDVRTMEERDFLETAGSLQEILDPESRISAWKKY